MDQEPELSVVIAIVSDTKHLRGSLQALARQQDPPAMEIIVPHTGTDPEIAGVQSDFPEVLFPVFSDVTSVINHPGGREHHDELRARGLQLATGRIVALLEDHGRADAHWARRVCEAHEEPYAAAGGAIENEVDRPINWAVYFCDFGRYQNPVDEGPSFFLSDANISYKREALEKIRSVWADSFHETSVNGVLLSRKETLWLSRSMVVYQHRIDLSLRRAMGERYIWGRSFAGTRAKEISIGRRFFFLALSPLLPAILVTRKIRDIVRKKRLLAAFVRSFPLIVLLTLVWSGGEFVGYLTGRPASAGRES